MSSTDLMAPPGDQEDSADNSNSKSSRNMSMAQQWAGSMLQSTKHTVQSWTVRKYTLPDKHVASQVLMYRQLLHTACRPNLTLSREYQGTPAQKAVLDMPWWSQGILQSRKMIISYQNLSQKAVLDMPWWSQGILQSRKMIISYQNLLARLWVAGACTPYDETWRDYYQAPPATATASATMARLEPTAADTSHEASATTPAISSTEEKKDAERQDANNNSTATATEEPPTELPDQAKFRAPVPHNHWVDRLGFQQDDPVTDFRSGGVLSLAMMVHLVESCPQTHGRFILDGDAAMLPFGLTCINITDMMAKFLMLSKAVDRMDALLSQKPFWRMFADPHAMLVCQETAMQLTADVVVELQTERGTPVTVFDFANILAIVEQRMEYDYLMAGPASSSDLRKIHARNKIKYQQQLHQRMQLARSKSQEEEEAKEKSAEPPTAISADGEQATATVEDETTKTNPVLKSLAGQQAAMRPRLEAVQQKASVWKDKAASVAGNVWTKMKTPGFSKLSKPTETVNGNDALAIPNDVHDDEEDESDTFTNNPPIRQQQPPPSQQAETAMNGGPVPSYPGDLLDDGEDVDL
eukprot:CAMPEP_0172476068 /NCGR_PEP_ID=MMETSP1065-20121228/70191_1 /TAXON_ID=265537 /ORGANISM="Amphiprora paludosa, Strain CCMP125" /LENGTH=581 /DNA_ID=CAMNT_0013234283 /DNA_START=81 /DNA_END=1826 /DNA_ORIENTATION=-